MKFVGIANDMPHLRSPKTSPMKLLRLYVAAVILLSEDNAYARYSSSSDGSGFLFFFGLIGLIFAIFKINGWISRSIESGVERRKAEVEALAAQREAQLANAAEAERRKTLFHADQITNQIEQKKEELTCSPPALPM